MVKENHNNPSVPNTRKLRRNNLTALALGLIIIILVNIISARIFTRFDLTSEKRFTLSEATKDMLAQIDDLVYFRVYLEGEFPAGFKKLQRETIDMLNEFRAYNSNIEYEFINPTASSNATERQRIFSMLVEKGLEPTDLQVKTKEGTSSTMIFPGAIVAFQGREMAVSLLASRRGVGPEEVLNSSIQNLEFALADAIRKVISNKRPAIAFIEGHGELTAEETADAYLALNEYYSVQRVRLDGKLTSLSEREGSDTLNTRIRNKFQALITAQPDSAFSDKDKFIIDQHIMRGGRVLWLIDPVAASLDSLQTNQEFIAMAKDLNLTDLFFNYGFRINNNLVMDLSALPIPVKVGQTAGQPKFDFFPWFYFPILTPATDDPIVKNLNAIKTEFISSIDFVETTAELQKEVLLTSSRYSRTVNTPVLISLEMLGKPADERLYSKKYIPVAARIEGKFKSMYDQRMPPEILKSKEIDFKSESPANKMIVVADGDLIRNQMQRSAGKNLPLPLGYDKYTGQQFGNKDLLLNMMNYLTDDSGLISIRSRELKIRLLDQAKIENERLFWQVLNIGLPILLVLIFGLVQAWLRRRRYTK
ncbi:MAG TPA: gliding motility-associated ABC transporter substrate-binding protein GldG [Bacteroidales bacterium]|nr:gliding motility-associated ABC transporter substrate-binding protein GldG [Bacteroidales bacterium]